MLSADSKGRRGVKFFQYYVAVQCSIEKRSQNSWARVIEDFEKNDSFPRK
jgi:hypothetical protein